VDVHLVSALNELPSQFSLLLALFSQLLALFSQLLALFSQLSALFSQLSALFSQLSALFSQLLAQLPQGADNLTVGKLFTWTTHGLVFEIWFVGFWRDHVDTFWSGYAPTKLV